MMIDLFWLKVMVIVIVGLAFVGWLSAHLFLHIKPSRLDSFNDLMSEIGQGQPTLIYFYSNF